MIAACGVNGLTCTLVQAGGYFIRSGVIKSIVAIGLAAGLVGCGNSRQIKQDEATRASPNLNTPASPDPNTPASPDPNTQASPDLSTPASPDLNTPASPDLNTPASPDLNTPVAQNLNTPASPNLNPPPSLNLNDALAECRSGYPDQITQAVARAACVIKATQPLRPLLPFPDLLDRENALRKSLAEQVQSGSISLLERNRQMTKLHASIVAEEEARLKEKPTEVGAKSLAVTQWRLSNPDGCTSLGGNTANCY
jgi:hypothetical protein